MAFTTPRTWVVGEITTAAQLNEQVRDNTRYLKGLDGAITLSHALILPDGAGYYIHIPALTTAQRDGLTPTNGMLIYNSTTTKFNKYENGAWRADLAYQGDLSTMQIASQAQGDVLFRGAAAWQRLAASADKYLRSAGAGADVIWAAIEPSHDTQNSSSQKMSGTGSSSVTYYDYSILTTATADARTVSLTLAKTGVIEGFVEAQAYRAAGTGPVYMRVIIDGTQSGEIEIAGEALWVAKGSKLCASGSRTSYLRYYNAGPDTVTLRVWEDALFVGAVRLTAV